MASPKTAIRTGDVRYDIEVSKIPYLSSFVNFQANAQPQSTYERVFTGVKREGTRERDP
jgi:hypothetical protein